MDQETRAGSFFAALAVALSVAIGAGTSSPAAEPQDQVVGFYTRGSLVQATPLAEAGPGWVHLFHTRNRGWGSQGLVEILEWLAVTMSELHPGSERLQIGDLSARAGGKVSGHASHQNGLDADAV